MPDNSLQDIFSSIEATKDTIKFLKKNKKEMVDLAIDTIKNNKNYYSELEKDDNLEIFKDSIINGHIQWIIEDLYHPNSVPFNEFDIYSIRNIPQAYYDIYVYLDKYIGSSSISKNSKEILKDYFRALSKIFI